MFINTWYADPNHIKRRSFPMEEKEKTAGQLRREELLDVKKNGYDRLSAEDEAAMER